MAEKIKSSKVRTWRDINKSSSRSKKKSAPISWRARMRSVWIWTKRVVVLILALCAIWGIYYAYENTNFEHILQAKSNTVSKIEFKTDGLISGVWLKDYLKISKDSKISDVNIFAIKGALEALGQVKSANVERVYPDTLKISISEHIPILKTAINIDYQTRTYLIADSGELYENSDAPKNLLESLPFAEGLNIKFENGKPLPYKRAPQVASFLNYARSRLPQEAQKWHRIKLGALESRTLPIIEVINDDGVRILFLSENLKKQFDRLDYILRYSVQKPLIGIEKIDLTLDDRSDVKLKTP